MIHFATNAGIYKVWVRFCQSDQVAIQPAAHSQQPVKHALAYLRSWERNGSHVLTAFANQGFKNVDTSQVDPCREIACHFEPLEPSAPSQIAGTSAGAAWVLAVFLGAIEGCLRWIDGKPVELAWAARPIIATGSVGNGGTIDAVDLDGKLDQLKLFLGKLPANERQATLLLVPASDEPLVRLQLPSGIPEDSVIGVRNIDDLFRLVLARMLDCHRSRGLSRARPVARWRAARRWMQPVVSELFTAARQFWDEWAKEDDAWGTEPPPPPGASAFGGAVFDWMLVRIAAAARARALLPKRRIAVVAVVATMAAGAGALGIAKFATAPSPSPGVDPTALTPLPTPPIAVSEAKRNTAPLFSTAEEAPSIALAATAYKPPFQSEGAPPKPPVPRPPPTAVASSPAPPRTAPSSASPGGEAGPRTPSPAAVTAPTAPPAVQTTPHTKPLRPSE